MSHHWNFPFLLGSKKREKMIYHIYHVFQIIKKLLARLISEHKESRVPGQPRDFLDCYLDELDKVCVIQIKYLLNDKPEPKI